ncbi:MAG: alpha/beta fold hydrolase [Ezakiella sp.]|nr:alpha/beta fold hydrolase [Ezakiella sp.]
MDNKITVKSNLYDIPAIFSYPKVGKNFPTVILCHGTGSSKNEVGNLFVRLAESLRERGIASIRFDFAGCGESRAKKQDLTFYGEVDDLEKIYAYIRNNEKVDPCRIAILGFSQGARVMAEFLGKYPEKINAAISWSGACHNGEGVFAGWFQEYYEEAIKNGYTKIPMPWRDDLILSKQWFDDIRNSSPMESLSKYNGAILAVSGTEDALVPYTHAKEIVGICKGKVCESKIIEDADHTFNVLEKDQSIADRVVKDTADWITINI